MTSCRPPSDVRTRWSGIRQALIIAVCGLLPTCALPAQSNETPGDQQLFENSATGERSALVPFTSWAEASTESAPLALYLSRASCSFCPRFEREVLGPVLNSGLYHDVVFRQLVLDDVPEAVSLGPLGATVRAFTHRIGLVGTPTVLFMDNRGNEIARRYVGHTGDDYMIYRFERSLKEALHHVGRQDGSG